MYFVFWAAIKPLPLYSYEIFGIYIVLMNLLLFVHSCILSGNKIVVRSVVLGGRGPMSCGARAISTSISTALSMADDLVFNARDVRVSFFS